MDTLVPAETLSDLSTPHVADACVRLSVPLRIAPPGIHALMRGDLTGGAALPVRVYGSVDIMLEAIDRARPGDVMVVDNSGRRDEGCIGDLTVLEAQEAGIAAIVVWGCHRDTSELLRLGVPVFSYGSFPKGPTRDDPRDPEALERVAFGESIISRTDYVFADDDGVLFVAQDRLEEILETARTIMDIERAQAASVQSGTNLRTQLRFKDYLAKRADDPRYGFRTHLRSIGGAIEE